MSIRVLVVDDQSMVRVGFRLILESEEEIEVVGEAEDGISCADAIARSEPDVVVLDLSMPGLDGLEVLERVRTETPEARIVVFSGFAAERMEGVTKSLGADRYLEKGAPLDEVRATILEVARAQGRPA